MRLVQKVYEVSLMCIWNSSIHLILLLFVYWVLFTLFLYLEVWIFFSYVWICRFWSFSLLLIRKIVVHLKTKAVCFRNVVFIYSVTIEKVEIYIRDISHVTPLFKNCSIQKVCVKETYLPLHIRRSLFVLYIHTVHMYSDISDCVAVYDEHSCTKLCSNYDGKTTSIMSAKLKYFW
jgi:hypothetical protein